MLLCPICEHELGTGEDEVRRQSWCVKSCGHVSLFVWEGFFGRSDVSADDSRTDLLWGVCAEPWRSEEGS